MKEFFRKILGEKTINFYHKVNAMLASFYYGFPSRDMVVIGVTGTNGKSTTSYMISKILDESGNKNAMITTIYYKIGDKLWRNNSKMSSLDPWKLQKFLKKASDKKCRYVVVETTSHAIVQNRIWGIDYDTLVFTNLTHDHLDYHGNLESYLQAKLKLFVDNPKARAVINADDRFSSRFKKASGSQVVTYGFEKNVTVRARKVRLFEDGSSFELQWMGHNSEGKINLAGKFNISNAMAAFCVGLGYNIISKTIIKALENIKGIPGRMESLELGQDFKVIVDFAHAPDGLQKVFESVKPAVKGRLIHVGGATGDRDKTKRPILGALAGKYADIAIVTDEDPGSEKPEEIIEEVAKGVIRGGGKRYKKELGKNFFKILKRKEAIEFALENAKRGDVVLITGKGHERVMKVEDQLIPYSDQEVVKNFFGK